MAEISPELAAKIQDLEVRYDENPGRVFVALASAYREAGEIGRAEELLRSGLKRHPGSLSAHVLLGRCLADRGAVGEANNEFRYVLSVDPQNLIALRTLGEMSAAGGDPDEASRWYRELLAVDPMNKEARDALDALASAPRSAPSAAAAAPSADAAPEFGMVDIDTSAVSQPPAAGAAAPGDFGMLDFEITPLAPSEPSRAEAPAEFGMVDPGAGFEISPEPEARPADAGVAEFGMVDFGAAARPSPADETPAEFGMVDLSPSPEAPASPASEPAFSGGFGGWGEVSLQADEPAPSSAPSPAAEQRMGDYDAFSFGADDADAGALPASSAPAGLPDLLFGNDVADAPHDDDGELVTETMAELYARQGFHDRAADVYRELIRRRGEEPALVARLREVEAMAAPGASTEAVAEPWEPIPGDLGLEEAPEADGFGGVDAGVTPFGGEDASSDAGDLPLLETGLPGLGLPSHPDFPAYEPEPAGAAASSSSAALASTGDVFADSFAHGFEGTVAGVATLEPAAAAAPVIEATGEMAHAGTESALAPEAVTPIAGQPQAADSLGASHADEPVLLETPDLVPTGHVAFVSVPAHDLEAPDHEEAPLAGGGDEDHDAAPAAAPATTMAGYLASLLAWRPGGAASPQAPAVTETAPEAAPPSVEELPDAPPAEVVEAVTSLEAAPELVVEAGLATESAPDAGTTEEVPVAEWELPAPPAAEAPADAPAAEVEPWSAPPADEGTAPEAEEDLPWIDTVAPAPPAEAAPADEPAPWDAAPWEAPAAPEAPAAGPVGLDAFQIEETPLGESPREMVEPLAPAPPADLLPWEFASEPPAAQAPEPEAPAAAEPAAGGFSFEDFFSAPPAPEPQAAAPAPEPVAEPAPEAPAAPAAQGGAGDDDEDLESFQAWLQSLKR